ncbi:MAG: APC family permease [Bacillota bacterium]|nr:APC family permease [Bacillota bacterium]
MEENINNTSPAAGGEQPELRRVLKLPTLVCQGLAYLCPACVLLYYGIINALTDGNFPLALLVAGFAMSLTAFSYSKMCREYPVSGSVYSYTTNSIGPKFGFIAGWTIMLDYFLLPMTCYLSCGLYLNVMFPAIPIWVWIIISVLICGACNYFGIGISSIVNNINVILPIAGIIFTIVAIAIFVSHGGGEGTLFTARAICNPETLQVSTLMTGAAIMAVVFVGFDSVTTYSEETIEPEKEYA